MLTFYFFSHSEEDNLPIKEIMPGPNGSIPTAYMYIPACLVCKYTFTELSRVLYIIQFPPPDLPPQSEGYSSRVSGFSSRGLCLCPWENHEVMLPQTHRLSFKLYTHHHSLFSLSLSPSPRGRGEYRVVYVTPEYVSHNQSFIQELDKRVGEL